MSGKGVSAIVLMADYVAFSDEHRELVSVMVEALKKKQSYLAVFDTDDGTVVADNVTPRDFSRLLTEYISECWKERLGDKYPGFLAYVMASFMASFTPEESEEFSKRTTRPQN